MKDILAKSLLNKIERLEAFEERLDVRFENISIKIKENNHITIFTELHKNNGTTIDETIQIMCVAYDLNGQILEVDSGIAFKSTFFGFQIYQFDFQEDNVVDKIGKIRIYPKL